MSKANCLQTKSQAQGRLDVIKSCLKAVLFIDLAYKGFMSGIQPNSLLEEEQFHEFIRRIDERIQHKHSSNSNIHSQAKGYVVEIRPSTDNISFPLNNNLLLIFKLGLCNALIGDSRKDYLAIHTGYSYFY